MLTFSDLRPMTVALFLFYTVIFLIFAYYHKKRVKELLETNKQLKGTIATYATDTKVADTAIKELAERVPETTHLCTVTLKNNERVTCRASTKGGQDFDEFNDFIHWFQNDFSMTHSFEITDSQCNSYKKFVFSRDGISSITYIKDTTR